jgi:hypothetical protein
MAEPQPAYGPPPSYYLTPPESAQALANSGPGFAAAQTPAWQVDQPPAWQDPMAPKIRTPSSPLPS